MDETALELELPGFRFHPTEEELLDFYLKKIVFGKKFRFDVIGFLNIYGYDPWELPGLAKIGEREWYFFVPRNRKQGNGGRPNRTTEHGFWKATGSDRHIRCLNDPKRVIGLKKTLVFYRGRAPHGSKTDWVMNEYRMPENCTLPKEDIVLCKIYRKATSLKVLEQRAVMEEESKTSQDVSPASTPDTVLFADQDNFTAWEYTITDDIVPKTEAKEDEQIKEIVKGKKDVSLTTSSMKLNSDIILPELQLPTVSLDWTQDPFGSPWLLDMWTTYTNIINL